jgi:hypothetical protein
MEGGLGIRSPYPAPEWAVKRALEGGEDDFLKLTGIALKEMAEQLPVMGGSIRYSSSWRGLPLPAAYQTIQELGKIIPKMLDTGFNPDALSKQDLENAARVLGLPGASQAAKYMRRRQEGMNHWESIIGVRVDIPQKKKGGYTGR